MGGHTEELDLTAYLNVLQDKEVALPDYTIRYLICKERQWTIQEYESQPIWFIEEITAHWQKEGDVAKLQAAKIKK